MKPKQQQELNAVGHAKSYICTVPTARVDAGISAQREAVRQGMVKELDVRTRVAFASFGVKTLEEYTRAVQRSGGRERPVRVRMKVNGAVVAMGHDLAVGAILRGVGTLVEVE